MIGHIHRLANDLSILKQIELNHDHFNFVVSLVGAGSCDVFQSICRVSEFDTSKLNIFANASRQGRT
ncbi:MAG: hypothetical protein ACRC2A_19640 [Enterobacterales bacterium]|uniref:hypothetical protein n=1 Tax=Serratia sp. (in: enterobacteria) TaxID=616 RepID=UPI003F2F9D1B